MKNLITLLSVVAAGFVAAPNAEARNFGPRPACVPAQTSHTYVSGYTACGCPIYTTKYVNHYNPLGYPVYAYRTQPTVHRCRPAAHPHHGHGHAIHQRVLHPGSIISGHRRHTSSGLRIGPVIVGGAFRSGHCR